MWVYIHPSMETSDFNNNLLQSSFEKIFSENE